jgi:hypothetical protein
VQLQIKGSAYRRPHGYYFLVERADLNRLLASVKEMEELLQFPTVAGHVEKASKLALLIARNAPNGAIANLAMRVTSEAHALRASALPLRADRTKLNQTLWHLRLALQEVKSRETRQ